MYIYAQHSKVANLNLLGPVAKVQLKNTGVWSDPVTTHSYVKGEKEIIKKREYRFRYGRILGRINEYYLFHS